MKLRLMAAIACWFVLATPAGAQMGGVDCRNGAYCPAGNVCLVNGMCQKLAPQLPAGSTRSPSGTWCEPGMREHKYRTGLCVPNTYIDCEAGHSCLPGSTCAPQGCMGANVSGPLCSGAPCPAGFLCSSSGLCIDPAFVQDCRNGTTCSKVAACLYPTGCGYVEGPQTPQIRY